MAITSGTHYFGPGEALTDWNAVASEINGQTLTGDVTFVQRGDILQSVASTIAVNFQNIDLNSRVLRFTSASQHYGNPLAGYKTTFESTNGQDGIQFSNSGSVTTGRIEFDGLQFITTRISGAGISTLFRLRAGRAYTFKNIIHLKNHTTVPCAFIGHNNSQIDLDIYNVKLRSQNGTMSIVAAFQNLSSGRALRIENVTSYLGSSGSCLDVSNITTAAANRYIKNCIGASPSGASSFTFGALAQSYNASSDSTATGTGSVVGFNAAANFISVDPTNVNFLNLRAGSLAAYGTSTTIPGNTVGIRANLRPNSDGLVSMGADQLAASSGFELMGAAFSFLRWPKPSINRAIEWEEMSSMNWVGFDRTISQDIHEASAVFRGKAASINALQTSLNSARESFLLTGFGAHLFSPLVDHSGPISVTAMAMPPRSHLAFANPITGCFQIEVKFRAISPPLVSVTPSLASLRPVKGYEADKSFEVGKAFTYGQDPIYSDRASDIGRYVGTFMQTTAEAQAILAYICVTARAGVVSMPTIPGEPYPFGVVRGTYPLNCRIKSVEISRKDLRYWMLKIEFVEEAA